MDEHTTCSPAGSTMVGDRSDDKHWIVVAVLDSALPNLTATVDHVGS